MDFTFVVNVTVEHREGKFASRDEIAEQLVEAIESANNGELTGENGGTYEIADWTTEEEPQKKPAKVAAAKTPVNTDHMNAHLHGDGSINYESPHVEAP